MKDLILQNSLTAVLGLACIALAVILAIELLLPPAPPAIPDQPSQAPRPSSTLKEDDFSLPPLSQYREIIERPLFLQSRRPVPKEGSDTSPLAAKETRLNQYTLTAVIIVPDKRLALIRGTSEKEKKTLRLEEGQDFQGWKLKEIKDELAVFQQGNQELQELRLQRKTPQFAFDKSRLRVPSPSATPDSAKKGQGKVHPLPPLPQGEGGQPPRPNIQSQPSR